MVQVQDQQDGIGYDWQHNEDAATRGPHRRPASEEATTSSGASSSFNARTAIALSIPAAMNRRLRPLRSETEHER
jgi:hypothetical protein